MSENLSEAKCGAVKEIQARVNENTENAKNRKNSFVGFPLKLLGHAFDQFFSYVIGFNWVIKLSYRVDVPHKSLKLPTIDYVYALMCQHFSGHLY